MSIESSINKVSNIRVFFIFLIITKIECWPVFKQDPVFFYWLGGYLFVSHCELISRCSFQWLFRWISHSACQRRCHGREALATLCQIGGPQRMRAQNHFFFFNQQIFHSVTPDLFTSFSKQSFFLSLWNCFHNSWAVVVLRIVLPKFPNGIVLPKFPNGIVLPKFPNGIVLPKFPNGIVLPKFPNGIVLPKFPNGIVLPKFHNGIVLPKFPNGIVLPKFPNGIVLPKFPNGIVLLKFPNGIVLPKFPNGIVLPKFPNGIVLPKFPNRIVLPKFPNGIVLPKFPNGIVLPKFPNGIVLPKFPNELPSLVHGEAFIFLMRTLLQLL